MKAPIAVACLLICLLKSVQSQDQSCGSNGDVRLVNSGTNSLRGTVEVCVNETWGTVCNDGFNSNAAVVVCRQLGVTGSDALAKVETNIFFGSGQSVPIHLDELQCRGTEQNLLECQYSPIDGIDCDHEEDVGVICERSEDCIDGDVRLVNETSYSATEGRVEFCVGGLWGTVCNYEWGNTDAAVVCRQLGLNTLDPSALTQNVPQVTNQLTPIVLDSVNCRGTEQRLAQCGRAVTVEYCSHIDDAGAYCTNIIECSDGDLRLVRGEMENGGQVEYCKSNRWGLVCYNSWDSRDANVVCRQLGYHITAGEDAQPTSERLPAEFLINLNRVNCAGNETRLAECPRSDAACLRPGAGVICPTGAEPCSVNGAVRLVGGRNSLEGRVEVCAGTWGTVCNDGFNVSAARVVCRQLGVSESALLDVITNIYFEGGQNYKDNENINLDEVACSGVEQNLLDCSHYPIGVSDCTHEEDAGVICGRSEDCIDGDVRLVNESSYSATEGRVEFCVGGLWGTVCDYEWDSADAAVVCRQLGLTDTGAMALFDNVPPVTNEHTPIVLDGVLCRRGDEQRLDQCDHHPSIEYCSHVNDAGVFCTPVPAVPDNVTTPEGQDRISKASGEKTYPFFALVLLVILYFL